MSAEERNEIVSKWRKHFETPDDKTAAVEYRGHTFPGYNQPVESDQRDKKMMVLAKKGDEVRLLHFGQKGYKHNYSPDAKKDYLTRSAGIRNGSGELTKDDPFSPNYWARRVLWPAGRTGNGESGPTKTAALMGSKEHRQATHRVDAHFRSSDPEKWSTLMDSVKRKSFVAAVKQDTRADPKFERHVDQMNRLLTGTKVDQVSVGDGVKYDIMRLRGGGYGCTCPDWRYKKSVASEGAQDCKHIVAWKGMRSFKKTASVLSTLAAHPKSLFTAGTAAGVGALALGLRHNAKSTQFTPAQKQMRSTAMHEVAGLGMLASPYVVGLAEAGAEALGSRSGRVGMAARAAHSVLQPLSHVMHGEGHAAPVLHRANELLGLGVLMRPALQEMHHLGARAKKHASLLAGM
jgi:predicted nucleic acid-binding Zn finger protein